MPSFNFKSKATEVFDFLKVEYGYTLIESTESRIRFESSTVFIEITFDQRRSYEIDLLIGQMRSGTAAFTMQEILQLRQVRDRQMAFQASNAEAVTAVLVRLGYLFKTYGGNLIVGDNQAFEALTKQRTRNVEDYALERHLQQARTLADSAWRKKDYKGVVSALKPLRAALTAVEVGKLEFAEKQVTAEDQTHHD